MNNRQIAEQVGCTPQWVKRIIHRFNADGIDAITWYPTELAHYFAASG